MSFIRVDDSAKTMIMEPFEGLEVQRQPLSPPKPAPPVSPSISQAFMLHTQYDNPEPDFDAQSQQSSISPVLHQLADCRQRLQEVQDAQRLHHRQTHAEMERHKHKLGEAIDALQKGLQHQSSQDRAVQKELQQIRHKVASSTESLTKLRQDYELSLTKLRQDVKMSTNTSLVDDVEILGETVTQHEETLQNVQNQLHNLSIQRRPAPGWASELDRINRELNQECFEIREKLDNFRCLGLLGTLLWGVSMYWLWASSAVVPEAVLY